MDSVVPLGCFLMIEIKNISKLAYVNDLKDIAAIDHRKSRKS